MKVTVLSKAMFQKYVADGLIEKNKDKKVFYLSINNPDDVDKTPFREDSKDFKSMWFYDIEESFIHHKSGITYDVITDNQLQEIYDYLIEHKDYDYFIVHCTAGVSRSGAVGAFANDLFGEVYQTFKSRNKSINPNSYISSKLKELFYKNNL